MCHFSLVESRKVYKVARVRSGSLNFKTLKLYELED
jgi:hypothetical protein